jgi:disulfide bond formation protein DsbB
MLDFIYAKPLRWPMIALATSIVMLATAHAFERFGGLAPCLLCLRQREAYWAAIALSLAVIIALRFNTSKDSQATILALLALAFATGAVIAFYHAGVEWKFWPGPKECAAGGIGNFNGVDIAGALGAPVKVVRCDEVPWSFLALSMAGWNSLISLGLAAASALACAVTLKRKEPIHG